MDELDPVGRLFGEVIALRLVVQRIMGQLAAQSGAFDRVMQMEHDAVFSDLSRLEVNDQNPKRADLIRMHAESVLDQIYSSPQQGEAPR